MNNYISVAILIVLGVVFVGLLLTGDGSVFEVEVDKTSRALDYLSNRV